jgi:hypothetical protein
MTRSLLMLALAGASSVGLAAPPNRTVDVNVTNPVLPVEVSNADPVPVRDVDAAAREPFQTQTVTTSFNSSSSSADIVTVPAGKRLVVEHVSAWVNSTDDSGLASVTIGSGSQFDQLPCFRTGQTGNGLNHFYSCSMQTRYYVGPGETLSFFVSTASSDGGFHRSFVSGYYLPAP